MNALAIPSDHRRYTIDSTTRSSTPKKHQHQNLSQKLRLISDKILGRATKTRSFKTSRPQYIPVVEPVAARRSEFDSSCFPDYPAGTKNDSLINSTIIPVVPANPLPTTLLVVIASPTGSLELKSKVADTSRGASNVSTSQSLIDAYLAQRKREEINKLMEVLESCLDSLDIMSHSNGAGESSWRPRSNTSISSGSIDSTPQKRSL